MPATYPPTNAQLERRLTIPDWIKYLFLGILFGILLPAAFRERPTAAHVRTEAILTSYQASTTAAYASYRPVFSFNDQAGTPHEVSLASEADMKPFAVGERVPLYYLPASPTQIILENDPYQNLVRIVLRTVSVPFFLLTALFLILRIKGVSENTTYYASLIVRFLLPGLVLLSLFIGLFVLGSSIPAHFSIAGSSVPSDQPPTWSFWAGTLSLVGVFAWYFLRWPFLIFALLRELRSWYTRTQERQTAVGR